MKKVSEYSERIVKQLSSDLKNELMLSIEDMIEGEDIDIEVSPSPTVTIEGLSVDAVSKEVEVFYKWLDDEDGLYYSEHKNLEELNINELICLWEAVKAETEEQ